MTFEGTVYRPPSEADSLLIQATVGCAWNKCTFCNMYQDKKFRIRAVDEIKADLREAVPYARHFNRIFLCDGDALSMPMPILMEILTEINTLYPNLEAVRMYASCRDVLRKTQEELNLLRSMKVDMFYIGVESGSDIVLKNVNKGITKQQMIDASVMLREADIFQSISIISGLGGTELMREHILETADLLNQMQPGFVGMLVLHFGDEMQLHSGQHSGGPSPQQVTLEMQLLLSNLELENSLFSSRHVSNYVPIRGRLPQDKQRMLDILNSITSQMNSAEM